MALLREVFVVREGPSDQVSPRVQKVMDGSDVAQFYKSDFLQLALLCLDQADIPLQVQNQIEKLVRQHAPEEDDSPDAHLDPDDELKRGHM